MQATDQREVCFAYIELIKLDAPQSHQNSVMLNSNEERMHYQEDKNRKEKNTQHLEGVELTPS